MSNQLFSTENFKIILEQSRKKGLNLEARYFPEVNGILADIEQCKAQIKLKRKTVDPKTFKLVKKEIEIKIGGLIKRKEEQLAIDIQRVQDNITGKNFSLELDKIPPIGDKDIYVIKESIESFFVIKQIQNNIKSAYNLEPSPRVVVLNRLIELLKSSSPKVILKTDIKQFNESIPQDRILSKLNNDGLLDLFSLDIISRILADYKVKSGNVTGGLPRGVGISIFLAELYIKDIDNEIQLLPDLATYLRFVDDIIIFFSPTGNVRRDYLKDIKGIIEEKYGLTLNEEKTFLINSTESSQRQIINYLGYKISFGGTQPLNIRLSERKVERYKKRIDLTFDSYLNSSRINEKKARKIFVKRIRFLTGNTRLLNDGNFLSGIYYSNSLLNDISDLIILDQYLTSKVETLIQLPQLKDRLRKFSYKNGFLERRFFPFSIMDLNKIMKILKNGI